MAKVEGRNVFLSGPMSDDAETHHVHDFVDAHVRMKRLGAAAVYNPAVHWLYETGPERSHEEYMRECIAALTVEEIIGRRYDLLVSLPGWQHSNGAIAERAIAKWCGIECCDLGDVE